MMFLKMMNIMKLTMMFTQRIVFLQTIMVFPQELFESFLRPPSTPDLPSDDDNFAANSRNNRGTSNFLRRPVITTQESNEFSEENNISGIDWVEDRNGSSLIIGTDYGIMRWNINSWARRSFSSYDLC
ncbi:BEM_collapsed_G0037990.mRNA.1.CDS.1 [Saccharomyces cerevisiae]|nr:BEM_collapsed_G0037990.mRNA.1.CDS.1 [Saccharomyces cerevisiae]